MKILLLTTHVALGGIGIYVLSLAKALVQREHEVFVASSGGNLVTPLECCGAKHLSLNIKTKSEISLKVFFACKEIERIIKEKNIQIMHAHTRVTQVLAHMAARKTGIPYVTTSHGFYKPRIFRRIFPCWGKLCIAISEAVREHLVNDLGVKKEKVVVVHNGVEMERFSPDKFIPAQRQRFKKEYGLKEGVPIIGTIARLSSVKGLRYLILAMPQILKAHPTAQLLLVGDGPEKSRLLNLTRQLGLEDNVFFIPSTLDTSVPLSVMDVFVFPSLLEGLGLAIIEAQAMALPVVASDVGGIYTLVRDGANGFLVAPRDPQALARAVQRLLRDKQKAREFGRCGRAQAEETFNLNQMVEGIEQVYLRSLKR